MPVAKLSARRALRTVLLLTVAAMSLGGSHTQVQVPVDPDSPTLRIPANYRGLSGRLHARIVRPPADSLTAPDAPVDQLFGPEAIHRPAVWAVRDSFSAEPFHFITLRPFAEKRNGRVGRFRVGKWPAEGRPPRTDAYRLPPGFLEVTRENYDFLISDNFRLGDFLDRTQADIWPKPMVLDERLVDKLELVIDELRSRGLGDRLRVLSGFRSPQSNALGARSSKSPESRHQYGDAADIIVDADGDRRMDDLTGDGRVNVKDALMLVSIVEAVEARHPDLVGGVGYYRAVGISGPFVHVDARGTRVRWGTSP